MRSSIPGPWDYDLPEPKADAQPLSQVTHMLIFNFKVIKVCGYLLKRIWGEINLKLIK